MPYDPYKVAQGFLGGRVLPESSYRPPVFPPRVKRGRVEPRIPQPWPENLPRPIWMQYTIPPRPFPWPLRV